MPKELVQLQRRLERSRELARSADDISVRVAHRIMVIHLVAEIERAKQLN